MPTWQVERGGVVLELDTPTKAPPTTEQIRQAFASLPQARPEDFTPQAHAPEGSAAGRFLSNAGEMLNPVTMAKGIGQAVMNPIDTTKALYEGQMRQFDKAGEAYSQGRYSEMFGHGAAGLLPAIGPVAAEAGEQIAAGDVAGGMGKGVGLLAPVVGTRPVVNAVRRGVKAVPGVASRVAGKLESGAARRVTDVISPRSTANVSKRLGGRAEVIAPTLAKDLAQNGAPLSRSGYHATVRGQLAAAEEGLDAAADARLAARSVTTQPVIDALKQKVAALTMKADDAERITRTPVTRTSSIVDSAGKPIESTAKPMGQDVIPRPIAARAQVLQQAIGELEQLGPTTVYDPLKLFRQAYDGQAKAIYNPSPTADFLAQKNAALGAADVTGVLREHLAKLDPGTATANTTYSLYKTADDVLSAAAELERVRPRVGRQIMARLTGALIGSAHGPGAAVAGYVGGPIIESAVASGATTQLRMAAIMQRLATAVRAGNVQQVTSWTELLKREASITGTVQAQRTSNPSESQAGRVPALGTP